MIFLKTLCIIVALSVFNSTYSQIIHFDPGASTVPKLFKAPKTYHIEDVLMMMNQFTESGRDPGGFRRLSTSNPLALEVGRDLFSNPILSGFNNISCATCHNPQTHTTDMLPFALGHGQNSRFPPTRGNRAVVLKKTPKLFNLGQKDRTRMFYRNIFFKNGRASLHRHENKLFLESSETLLNGWLKDKITKKDSNDRNVSKTVLKLANEVKDQIRIAVQKGQNGALVLASILPLLSPEEMLGEKEQLMTFDPRLANNVHNSFLAWKTIVEEYIVNRPLMAQKLVRAYNLRSVNDINIGHFGRAITEFTVIEFQKITRFDKWLSGQVSLNNDELYAVDSFIQVQCSTCHGRRDLGAPGNLTQKQSYSNFIFHNFRRFNNVAMPPIVDVRDVKIDEGRYDFLVGRIYNDPHYAKWDDLSSRNQRKMQKDSIHDGVLYVSRERLLMSHHEHLVPSIRDMKEREPGYSIFNTIEDQVRIYKFSGIERMTQRQHMIFPPNFHQVYGNDFQFASHMRGSDFGSSSIGDSIVRGMRNSTVKEGMPMTEEQIKAISYFLRNIASSSN